MINHAWLLKKATLSWALAKCDEDINKYTAKMTGNPVIKPRRPVTLTAIDIRRPAATWAETDDALRAENEALKAENEALKGMLRAISERVDIINTRMEALILRLERVDIINTKTGGEPFSETGLKVSGDCCDLPYGYVVRKGQICGCCDREGDDKAWKDGKPLW